MDARVWYLATISHSVQIPGTCRPAVEIPLRNAYWRPIHILDSLFNPMGPLLFADQNLMDLVSASLSSELFSFFIFLLTCSTIMCTGVVGFYLEGAVRRKRTDKSLV